MDAQLVVQYSAGALAGGDGLAGILAHKIEEQTNIQRSTNIIYSE